MSSIFLDGVFVSPDEAKISVFDTGLTYGDAIYEVILLHNRKIVDIDSHLERMELCLGKVSFNNYPSTQYLKDMIWNLVELNKEISTGMIFIQITRGVSFDRYQLPSEIKKPTIIAYVTPITIDFSEILNSSLSCMLVEDPRRFRRDIKMTSLMPMILTKLEMREKNYDYVIYCDRITKAITEGCSSNLFIVTKDDEVLTHPATIEILPGCVRLKTIDILNNNNIKVIQKHFYEEDLLAAKECFVTGSVKLYRNVSKVNGINIGSNKPGDIMKLCFEEYKNLFL